jgi:hypothetical protein
MPSGIGKKNAERAFVGLMSYGQPICHYQSPGFPFLRNLTMFLLG